MNHIPYGRQNITQQDLDAVAEALRSDFLTQGPRIDRFEKAFAEYIGSKYAVAVANGTAALHLCALALNVQKGDKVITTPITFAASANCISYCGGEVIFSDIDPVTYLLDIQKVEKLLQASPPGTYKGIIPVDFAGRAVDMEECRKVANKYGLWIIEDSCHSPGGYFIDSKGLAQKCGNGKYADLAIFSFHPVKHIAAGEGGMITTNDQQLYEKLMTLRSHGIVKDESLYTNSIELAVGSSLAQEIGDNGRATKAVPQSYPGWYMEMQELGYNYRLTDMQAALGNSQLRRADEGLIKRKSIARRYAEAFVGRSFIKGQSLIIPGHAYHLYIIEVENRLELYNYLRKNNIFAQVHYIPCHLMPYYRKKGWAVGDMPCSEEYYSKCLSLPMYPTLSDEDLDFVIKKVINFYSS